MENKIKYTYVFGHKNPDTDTVCGAIAMSYLKNEMGYNTLPAVLGEINKETAYALEYFKMKEPMRLNDVKLQLRDVSYHKDYYVDKDASVKDAFDRMNKLSLTGIPIVEKGNQYYGYVSLKEIAKGLINGDYHKIDTSYDNLINLLNGEEVLKFDKEISGTVLGATYAEETFMSNVTLGENDILIIGDRHVLLDYAISKKVKLIILIAGSDIDEELVKAARKNKVNIIKTKLHSYEVAKVISYANYIKNYTRTESATFNEIDYLSDFQERVKVLKHTNYPVINSDNECKGLITLVNTSDVERKSVILVDHNNYSQSVSGLDEAEILEVIDHHNIGDINTRKPINFRNSFCGSVNTIIYDLYKENNIEIPKKIAGLMASAIISDTLLLTSPTTTIRDTDALINLAKIAKIDYKEYGMELLKAGMSVKGYTIEDLLYKDFKTYKIEDDLIGIGQVFTSDYEDLKTKIPEFVEYLDSVAKGTNYRALTLFITDVFEKKSYCLYNTSAEDVVKNSFKLDEVYEGVMLDGVVSRKAQIAPYIMDAIEK